MTHKKSSGIFLVLAQGLLSIALIVINHVINIIFAEANEFVVCGIEILAFCGIGAVKELCRKAKRGGKKRKKKPSGTKNVPKKRKRKEQSSKWKK